VVVIPLQQELGSCFYTETVPNANIKVGTLVKVALIDRKEIWYGTIVRLINNSYFMADHPISNNRDPLILHEGDEVDCKYTCYDGVYTFKTKIKSFLTDLNLVILENPTRLKKTEMREHVRLPVYIQVKVNEQYEGIVLNLSVGGLLLTLNHEFSIGDVVKVDFELDKTPFSAMGKMVRLGGDNGYGIQFVELDRSKRIALDRYVLMKIIENNQVIKLDEVIPPCFE